MNLSAVLPELLARVERPARYLGREPGSVVPDPRAARVRIALVFPDLYDLGLGNLGLHILYRALNETGWCAAERACAPAPDMAAELRRRGLRLFALESRDTLDEFDAIGITLQSELTWTNVLEVIDLAGLPLRAEARREGDPLVFAGGPAAVNPEPLAPFLDFVVVGDGEEVIVEIAEVLDAVRDRRGRLEALAGIAGVYVPALHPVEVLPGGMVRADPSVRVVRRVARSLDRAEPAPIVPFVRLVHDRAAVEVLRGCTQGCRFCQAGMVTRPVRERSPKEVARRVADLVRRTGYEEVGLVSLSTCDHSRVREMVDLVVQRTAPGRVAVSLPSLRLDSFSVDLADLVAGVRRTGLTVAPEAATPRLRALINKWIPDEDLLEMAERAYALGWEHLKLYFMIGLPTEREEDVDAIAELALRVLEVGRRHNRRARVHTGVSTFVPKPHTPLQWARQVDRAETRAKQARLAQRFRRARGVRFGRHDPDETFIEGLLARADRRAADLVEAAWRRGARFDAWDEHRRIDAWEAALRATGLDPAALLGEREVGAPLPWDHVDVLVDPAWLRAEWHRAMELEHAEDCRRSRCHRCGVIDRERELCATMLRRSIEGRKREAAYVVRSRPERPPRPGEPPRRAPAPPPVERVVLRVGVVGDLRFLSHLEATNAWLRALRRAGAPLAWSEGFHPHPRVNFSGARPVGEESVAEWMDVALVRRLGPGELARRLRAEAPEGMRVFEAEEVPLDAPSLMSRVEGARVVLVAREPAERLAERAEALVAAPRLEVRRRRKKGRVIVVDARPHVAALRPEPDPARLAPEAPGLRLAPGEAALVADLRVIDGRGLRPAELVELLGLEPADVRVVRVATRLRPLEGAG